MSYANLPDFDSLPPVKDMPRGCAWGVFDKDGKKDHLGCLNLLTPAVVKAALAEATDGVSVSLNWTLGAIHTPGFGRKTLEHKVISFQENANPALRLHGFDDVLDFNTQESSQWDSLVHFAHQPSGLGYNGANMGREDLVQSFGCHDTACKYPTLNHWHARGCLVGRGVLLDYRLYADTHGIAVDCFSDHQIHVEDLEKVAAWEGVELRQGDIIIVRTGFTEELGNAATAEQQQALMGTHKAIGVFGSEATARWFWNKHPAAVAGDAIAFEQLPPLKPDGTVGTVADLVLHQYFLSLFGMTIGELWDLKALSKTCAEKKKYSFLLTSSPLNVPGSVGSPPNAIAIF